MSRRFNSVLQSEEDIDFAIQRLSSRGFPIHPDRAKNWDVDLAIEATTLYTWPSEPVMDAGGDRVSPYLPSLVKLKYRTPTSVNLLHDTDWSDGVHYVKGDIENLSRWRAGSFGFIACLSVIEHGIDVGQFLREASRLLRPGGNLFISTDVWSRTLPTPRGWQIFTVAEIRDILDLAPNMELLPVGEVDLRFGEPLVKHEGREYTFCNLLFRKE